MRWLLIATHVPADGAGGGIVRYTVELARALAQRSDVELHVLLTKPARSFFEGFMELPRLHVVPELPTLASSALELTGAFTARLRPRFDVIHGVKHLMPKVTSGCRVLTVHDMLLLDRPGDFGRAKRALLPAMYLDSIRRSDIQICVSNSARERLASYVPAAAERAKVVSLAAVDDVPPGSAIAELQGRLFALVVGDSSPRKNLAVVQAAWHRVHAWHPEMILVQVGPPAWGREEETEGSKGVLRLGTVSDAQLVWLYQNAHVVACPSLFEGFGLPAAEGRHFGATVLTSEDPALCEAAPGARRVYSRDVAGWAHALRQAMLAPRARAMSLSRTWADVGQETVEVVSECI